MACYEYFQYVASYGLQKLADFRQPKWQHVIEANWLCPAFTGFMQNRCEQHTIFCAVSLDPGSILIANVKWMIANSHRKKMPCNGCVSQCQLFVHSLWGEGLCVPFSNSASVASKLQTDSNMLTRNDGKWTLEAICCHPLGVDKRRAKWHDEMKRFLEQQYSRDHRSIHADPWV